MTLNVQLEGVATAAAEEVLRLIYGDDLEGCTVRLDNISDVIRAVLEENTTSGRDLAELHTKAFHAVQLLSTPPQNDHTLSAEDLRSLLSERLDKIQTLATKVLKATNAASAEPIPESTSL